MTGPLLVAVATAAAAVWLGFLLYENPRKGTHR